MIPITALRELTKADCEQVRQWRNTCLESLRTPFLLTEEMQADFYENVVCNRKADSRFWAVEDDGIFIGMIGLAGIQWENRIGEISLVLDPAQHGKGYGEASLNLLLEQGFGNLNLLTICGECYECSPAIGFWKHMLPTYMTMLPKRKYWKGKHYNSMYFCFMREVTA